MTLFPDLPPVLTLWRPWAELYLTVKAVENRFWWTRHRGPLLIHAGKTWDSAAALFAGAIDECRGISWRQAGHPDRDHRLGGPSGCDMRANPASRALPLRRLGATWAVPLAPGEPTTLRADPLLWSPRTVVPASRDARSGPPSSCGDGVMTTAVTADDQPCVRCSHSMWVHEIRRNKARSRGRCTHAGFTGIQCWCAAYEPAPKEGGE